ncbi:MAG: nitroreductase family deazaflavin-dependent oxidoreductase [Anaerolineae bacterium]|nr:nitroreductase family deazaflavin-dependent oxidoreductase [Anaerolineae bacterium]
MWYNPMMRALLRSSLHGLVSKNIMLLTYTGRRSAAVYTIPVNYVQDGSTLWATSFRNRVWWRNLCGGVTVELSVAGKNYSARGLVLDNPAEVVEALRNYLSLVPNYAKYFHVRLDADSLPLLEDVIRAAQERVMIRFDLQTPSHHIT